MRTVRLDELLGPHRRVSFTPGEVEFLIRLVEAAEIGCPAEIPLAVNILCQLKD